MKIETIKTTALIPYARNSRSHSESQVAQIAGSIREFGFTNPVLIDADNGIIAGHGRVMAAGVLGLASVPCIRLAHLTETQKRAYIIADNKLALNAGWDDEMLALELGELSDLDFDMDLIGFSEEELAALMAETTEGETDPDDVPEPPVDPVTVLGDVWVMGKHRIACGDCTDQGTVDKALNGVQPHLMVTDPPYGVEYDASWRTDAGINKKHQKVATGKVLNDDRADWRDAWALFPGGVAYVWHAMKTQHSVACSLIESDFGIRAEIVWAKPSLVMGRGHYHSQHESCFYAVRKNETGNWEGGHKQSTLWKIENMHASQGNVDDGKTSHSTQKPVECMKRPIENNSSPGQAVYEPFSGSGTTIIAGEMTGRCIHAIELNPAYVDVAVERWQAFAGKQAIHEASGKTFDDMKAAKP
jgi:DNA modification methylase